MPSEAAIRAARAIHEYARVHLRNPYYVMGEIEAFAEIIDREMSADLRRAAPDNAAFLKRRQKP